MARDRLRLNMTLMDIVSVMSEGNPGAINALMLMYTHSPKVDPQSAFGGFAPIFECDSLRIYGPRLWMFFKDVCKQDIVAMLAVLRAYQLGQLEGCTKEAIDRAIDNYGEGLDTENIVAAVKERLDWFDRDALAAQEEVRP